MTLSLKRETLLVQTGNDRQEPLGAINAPIYLSAPYRHQHIGLSNDYDYIRTGNPTRDILERSIAELEKGNRGLACSSGMSAIQLVFSLFTSEDHIIAIRDLYGGSYRMFEWFSTNYHLQFSFWDQEHESIHQLIQSNTKALFIETPTNPLMKETDIRNLAIIAWKGGNDQL